jgi:Ycf66 protein N-terminus
MNDRSRSGKTRDGTLVSTHPRDFSLGSIISRQRSGRVKASEQAQEVGANLLVMAFGIPASLLFGLVLIIASISLFLTSKLKPNLYEDSDNIYAIVGIVCGLLLMVTFDLGAAMAFQQLLLLSATISLMWRLINLRAENKQLKGTERSKSGYNARLEDNYPETPRERRQGKRRRDISYEDEDRRLLGDRQDSTVEPMLTRRRPRSFAAEDAGEDRYGERREPTVTRRRSNREDEEADWSDDSTDERLRQRQNPRTPQRALPDADLVRDRSPQRFDRDREDGAARFSQAEDRRWDEAGDTGTTNEFVGGASSLENRDNPNEDSTPRRRRNRSTRPDRDDERQDRPTDSRSAKGSMTAYVNYEPVNPEAGLPPSGTEEPIVFPDRY